MPLRVVALVCVLAVAAACGGAGPVLVNDPTAAGPAEPADDATDEAPDRIALADDAEAADSEDNAPGPTAQTGPTLRVALAAPPVFDPVLASLVEPADMAVLDLVYDGLTSWDPQRNTWVPALAVSAEAAPDGLTWQFVLGDATFTDGTSLDATHVVRSLERVRENGLTVPAARLDPVAEIVALDARTVEVVLHEPYAELPALLSSPVFGIVPDGTLDGTNGSGPFAGPGGTLVHRSDDLAVELTDHGSEDAAVRAFDRGDADLAFVSAAYEGATSLTVPSTVEVHFALRVTSPALDTVEERRAVVDAVSRTAVAAGAFGAGAGAVGGLVPDALACAAPCGGGQPDDDLVIEPLRIGYVADPAGREQVLAQLVADELASVGVTAEPVGASLDAFVGGVTAGDYDLIRTGWVGLHPSADSQLAPYRSTSADNVSGHASATFDELMATARASGATSAYDEARQELEDAAVVLPIARLRIRALVSDRVVAITVRHDGSIDLESLRLAG